MKKVIIFGMCFLMFVFIGCDLQKSSVGIIGGADGPTDINVSKNKTAYEREPIRMVKIDGALYYETGEDIEIGGRCGVMDGNFSKAVDMYELPQNDNESNFGDGNGYQWGSINDTVEILIGDDCEIFKKLDAEGVEGFKYCCRLESEGLGKDADYLVLSNKENVTLEEALEFLSDTNTEKKGDIYVMPMHD